VFELRPSQEDGTVAEIGSAFPASIPATVALYLTLRLRPVWLLTWEGKYRLLLP